MPSIRSRALARPGRACPPPWSVKPGQKRVVIAGAGFGGLEAAHDLAGADVAVTLVDRQNHHLFQPLLYQVATAALSPDDIATPVRKRFARNENIRVLMDEVVGVDTEEKALLLSAGQPEPYDWLVLATGSAPSYFGHADWPQHAPALKSLDDALLIRRRLLRAFEMAESCPIPELRDELLTFAVIGGGPTGVEMAGAMADLARSALACDFRTIDPTAARIVLLEAGPALLAGFPRDLADYAARTLGRMGVEVRLSTPVERIDAHGVVAGGSRIRAANVLWCAGVKATPAGAWLGVETTKNGTIKVAGDLSVPGHPDVFVVGDAAYVPGADGKGLPGLASVAKQEGRYAAKLIRARAEGRAHPGPFVYRDPGALATIGRAAAIADFRRFHFTGVIGWLVWAVAHIYYLIDFKNRVIVFLAWAWAWLTYGRGARVILGEDSPPGAPDASAAQPGPTLSTRSAPPKENADGETERPAAAQGKPHRDRRTAQG